MRLTLFFIALFVTVGCLLGAPVNNPFPNFGAVIILWFVYYLITLPGRVRRQYCTTADPSRTNAVAFT